MATLRTRLLLFSGAACLALVGVTAWAVRSPQSPPRQAYTTNSLGMRLARIPSGAFTMGLPSDRLAGLLPAHPQASWKTRLPTEAPSHRVAITRPFEMGACEVTVGQFRAFAEAAGYRTRAEVDPDCVGTGRQAGKPWQRTKAYSWKVVGFPLEDDHPAVNLTHHDAVAFCKWLSDKEGVCYRLPTEAEWEYACRAGTSTSWSYGDSAASAGDHSWYEGNSNDCFQRVGQKKPNAWGLHDLHGNVWEWCHDWYAPDAYTASERIDPQGPECGEKRVIRGGSYSYPPNWQRSTYRAGYPPNQAYHKFGFRVVREAR